MAGSENSASHDGEIPSWRKVAERREQEITSGISQYFAPADFLKGQNSLTLPQRSGVLSGRELELTGLTATKLLPLIHNGTYTSVEVTTAFCKRAAIAHQATNCLAWAMFKEALDQAATLDEHFKTQKKPKGPLHGLPISVKEHVNIKGTPATFGYISWADNIGDDDALLVKILRSAGAVFHVKTTNPQGLMAIETVSPLYGTSTNPYNSSLTCGGSTGGEGALIAMRGSLLGIGTDIGGSIRVPAGWSGIYGLKGSVGRIPTSGIAGTQAGMENISGVAGPMATSFEDLRLFYEVVLGSDPWNVQPSVIELPWKPTVSIPSKLHIGVMYHDGTLSLHPPVTRTLNVAVEAIKQAGHEVVQWDTSLHRDIVECINEIFKIDNYSEFLAELKAGGEPLTSMSKVVMDRIGPETLNVRDTWKLNVRRNDLQQRYSDQWNAAGIDAIICPVGASVASAHGECPYWGYTSVFNLLDYTALAFPSQGAVEEGDTWENYPPTSGEPLSEADAAFRAFYTGPEKYADAPVGLQLVTRRFKDEEALLIGEEIARILDRGL